ncbi:MAG: TnsD family transposase [Candidatus Thiodiazotropha sp. (ex. Lucinisca nassula)]|nr:TnsD family transposase [Candidatus Thiodiazotropha sp. (ex. Lucinisca nassula)]MBW9273072.1 TnsD family transposase [Candidatus Thiodiazotropha sp. (ex. Lucinisca nassula)]
MKLNLPVPQPDQTLESLCAAVCLDNGTMDKWGNLMSHLFGSRYIRCETMTPSGLTHLFQQYPPVTFRSVDDLIQRHSSVALYLPFLDTETRKRVTHKLANNTSGLTRVLGLNQFNPFRTDALYCEKCVEEEVVTYGFAYSHRSHQLRAVHFCHRHQLPLGRFQKDNHYRSFHGLLIPHDNVQHPINIVPEKKVKKSELSMSFGAWVESAYLGQLPGCSEDLRIKLITQRLDAAIGVPGTSKNFPTRIRRLLLKTYGNEFLSEAGLSLYDGPSAWPRLFASGYAYRVNPIANMLILNALFESPDEYRRVVYESGYQDAVAWQHGPGRTYPLTVWSMTIYRDMVCVKACKTIAEKYGISVYTVNELLEVDKELAKLRQKIVKLLDIKSHRKKLLHLLQTKVSTKRPREYGSFCTTRDWLREHDPDWLKEQIPLTNLLLTTSSTKTQILDLRMLDWLNTMLKQYRDPTRAIWINRKFLSNEIFNEFHVRPNNRNYPFTNQAISDSVENTLQFTDRVIANVENHARNQAFDICKRIAIELLMRVPKKSNVFDRVVSSLLNASTISTLNSASQEGSELIGEQRLRMVKHS